MAGVRATSLKGLDSFRLRDPAFRIWATRRSISMPATAATSAAAGRRMRG